MYQTPDTAHPLAALPVSALTRLEVNLSQMRKMTVVTTGPANFASCPFE